jgi:GxxExxY protein
VTYGDQDILVDEEMEPDPDLNRITNSVLGAAIEVHRLLGPGFPESVYGKALVVEFRRRGIAFEAEHVIDVLYKGESVGCGKLDFLVEGKVIVEIKAVEQFSSLHTAQVISYLRATHLRLGLLLNFNVRLLKDGIRRIAG